MSYLLLNVLFGGLPCWLGADVDWTWLTLAIIRYPVDRLKETERDASNFVSVLIRYCWVLISRPILQFNKCIVIAVGSKMRLQYWVWKFGQLFTFSIFRF